MTYRNRILVISALFALFSSGALSAEQDGVGKSEFKNYCAGCHGINGEGNGPFVEFLTQKPSDLTVLAKNNQGVFPFQRIYETIDGRQQIGAHGTKDMPIWGERYAMEIITQYGEYGAAHARSSRCRILELVFFLATLQK